MPTDVEGMVGAALTNVSVLAFVLWQRGRCTYRRLKTLKGPKSGRDLALSSSLPEMPPGIRPGSVPPFHLLDEYTFQDLCRDLFEEQETVSTCNVYGQRGEHQDGIDLRAQPETAME